MAAEENNLLTDEEAVETVEEEDTEEKDINFFELSDDDFLEMETSPNSTKEDTADVEESSSKTEQTSDDQTDDETQDTEVSETDSVDAESDDQDVEIGESEDDTENETESVEEDAETETEDTNIDYKVEYEKLLAPFKANGTQIQAANSDEIITLMQMGANYHKKMAGLKPSLKIVKLLEKNDLLDLSKINHLIDLTKKNPDAIKKLLKDSDIDPQDIDVTEDRAYKPTDRSVSDAEFDLDTVLDSIKDTDTYNRTLTVLTNEWDDGSRTVISANPHIIKLINDQVGDGTFDVINAVVQKERSLGKLSGMSDLDAYKSVGDVLYQNKQLPGQQVQSDTVSTKPKTKPIKTTVNKSKVKDQKKAVSSTRSRTAAPKTDFNPLALSDEEFEKVASQNLR